MGKILCFTWMFSVEHRKTISEKIEELRFHMHTLGFKTHSNLEISHKEGDLVLWGNGTTRKHVAVFRKWGWAVPVMYQYEGDSLTIQKL